jgi:geranylgeranyl diphosphate synthase type I
VELIHFFLLIHDDVIDRDIKRHGGNTINFTYQKLAKRIFPQKESEHFGNSMAIVIGDMVNALGNRVIYSSGFDSDLVVKALKKLQDITSYTVIGQMEDTYLQNKGKALEKEVLKMYEYKTARYTFEGPLQLGAILGGADNNTLDKLAQFSVPLGIAFQVRDDILGIFGSGRKTGKPIGSDIEEGKQTILLVKALEKADKKQIQKIKKILGKKNLNKQELESFQKIILETGALEYANKLISDKIKESKEIMKGINLNSESKKMFLSLADYIGKREK